jgi:hypothetical protein
MNEQMPARPWTACADTMPEPGAVVETTNDPMSDYIVVYQLSPFGNCWVRRTGDGATRAKPKFWRHLPSP